MERGNSGKRKRTIKRRNLTPVISLISSTVRDASVLILEVDWRKVIALRRSPSDASIRVSSASALH